MGSAVISIQLPELDQDHGHGVGVEVKEEKKKVQYWWLLYSAITDRIKKVQNMRKIIHSVKVGIALVVVSLLYLLDPLYKQVGDNAMWAIMTVVVVFEFYAGATLSKGLNRAFGTILGGGLGCLAATFAQDVGGLASAIIIATTVFLFGN